MTYLLSIDRRPLPLGEQANREYHSGDPGPYEEPCPDCGDVIEADDQLDSWMDPQTGDRYHYGCEKPHDLRRCDCATCDEDRSNQGWVKA